MNICPKSITDKLKVNKNIDPCPPRGQGTYKVANVCQSNPYVYYTPSRGISARDFNDAIDDLYLPFSFPENIRKFYMLPKCKIDKVEKKTDLKTAVVDKLSPVIDAMLISGPEKVIESYIQFISEYLENISKITPEDIWQVVSTDFKTDNIMIDIDSNRI